MRCLFTLGIIDRQTFKPKAAFRNLVLASGYDLMALAMRGAGRVNALYLAYTNGTASEPSFSASTGRSFYSGRSGDDGHLRIITLTEPSISSSAAGYAGNILKFFGSSEGAAESGAAFTTGSKVIACSLAYAPDPSDPSKDILYNIAAIKVDGVFTPIVKPANLAIGLTAAITFQPEA